MKLRCKVCCRPCTGTAGLYPEWLCHYPAREPVELEHSLSAEVALPSGLPWPSGPCRQIARTAQEQYKGRVTILVFYAYKRLLELRTSSCSIVSSQHHHDVIS